MELINIDVQSKKIDPADVKTDVLVLGMCSDDRKSAGTAAKLDKKLGGAISNVMKLGDFKARANTTATIYTSGKIGADRLQLVGLGECQKATLDGIRKAVATAANSAVKLGAKSVALAMHGPVLNRFDKEMLAEIMTEAAYFGAYRWNEFVSKSEDDGEKHPAQLRVTIIDSDPAVLRQMEKGIKIGRVVGAQQNWARTIANRPGNVVYPAVLADIAKQAARQTPGLKCTVLDDGQLKAKGMGGISAVGSGSANKPRFIILEYRGGKQRAKTIALCGKAITFDTGGISIKPSQGMEDMKLDKSGGVAVIATLKIAALLKLPINIYGLVPSAENMPSGSSVRPGDIVKTFSGKMVEIQNTDAEGRMVLCDAIAWAAKKKVDTIVDIATLTGACMVALGRYKAGLMSNNDDLMGQIEQAAKDAGEPVWHMPIGDEYLDEMKSKIADLKNIGSRWGGACNAAAFLNEFAAGIPWAHIDMAGVDLFESPKSYTAVGSSGYGVRLLSTFLRNLVK
jgi:leucyl aminopeptidase